MVVYIKEDSVLIKETLDKLVDFSKNNFANFEFIIINNSIDGNVENSINEFYKALEPENKIKLSMIKFTRRHSIDDALRAGLDFAIGDFVMEINLHDFNFEISKLKEIHLKAQSGYDLVSLVPKEKKSIGSKIFYKLLNHFSYFDLSIGSEAAFVLSRKCLNALSNIKDKIYYRKLLYNLVSNKSAKVFYDAKAVNKPDLSLSERIDLALDILFSFSNFGLKITNVLLKTFLVITISAGLYTIYQYLFKPGLISGWTTTMLLLSFGFSSTLMILSIIIRYLSLILKEVKTAPEYFISEIRKFQG